MSTTPRTLQRSVRTALAAALLAGPLALAPAASAATTDGSPQGPAWVRAAHLVPDLGKMDIEVTPFAGGTASGPATLAVAGAGYADVTAYAQYPSGFYSVAVRPAGSPPDTTAVVSGTVQTEAGGAYTLAALGSGDDATIVPLVDDLTPPPAGQARIRVLSAASSADAVDVAATDGPTITEGAAFGTATGYTDVPAGTWTLDAAAVDGSVEGTTTVTVDAGSVYTLAVTDAPTGGLTVAPLTDAAGMAQAPVGGAATGGGGTAALSATSDVPAVVSMGAVAAAGLATGLVLIRVRRTRRADL